MCSIDQFAEDGGVSIGVTQQPCNIVLQMGASAAKWRVTMAGKPRGSQWT